MMDYLDDIQVSANRVNKSLGGLIAELKRSGLPVIAYEEGGMDTDADITLTDTVSLQLNLDMSFHVCVWVDNKTAMRFFPCPTLRRAIDKLKEEINVQAAE